MRESCSWWRRRIRQMSEFPREAGSFFVKYYQNERSHRLRFVCSAWNIIYFDWIPRNTTICIPASTLKAYCSTLSLFMLPQKKMLIYNVDGEFYKGLHWITTKRRRYWKGFSSFPEIISQLCYFNDLIESKVLWHARLLKDRMLRFKGFSYKRKA